jgi:hypothetical protein
MHAEYWKVRKKLFISKDIYNEIKIDQRIELLKEDAEIFDSDHNLLPF